MSDQEKVPLDILDGLYVIYLSQNLGAMIGSGSTHLVVRQARHQISVTGGSDETSRHLDIICRPGPLTRRRPKPHLAERLEGLLSKNDLGVRPGEALVD